jgi:serine/threonine protein kinase
MQDGAPPGTPFFCSPEVVIPLKESDLFASDIETCKHVSASLGSFVIPATERESPFQWIKHLQHFSLK